VACDFVTIDTATLRRYYLLVFIDIRTRVVLFGGITTNPTGAWSTQAARNLSMCHRDLFVGAGALVRDRGRGSQFGDAFDEVFRSHNIKILKCPVRTPVANAYAERWIGTLRREFLDRTIIWNQCRLERLVVDYLDHYNTHRPPPPPQSATPERTRTCHAVSASGRQVQPLRRTRPRVPKRRMTSHDTISGTHSRSRRWH
jgi:putative transposase